MAKLNQTEIAFLKLLRLDGLGWWEPALWAKFTHMGLVKENHLQVEKARKVLAPFFVDGWFNRVWPNAHILGRGGYGIAYLIPHRNKFRVIKESSSVEEFRAIRRIRREMTRRKRNVHLPHIYRWGVSRSNSFAFWYEREYLLDKPHDKNGSELDRRDTYKVVNRAVEVLHSAGFNDLHENNFGWRGTVPVFFDFLLAD